MALRIFRTTRFRFRFRSIIVTAAVLTAVLRLLASILDFRNATRFQVSNDAYGFRRQSLASLQILKQLPTGPYFNPDAGLDPLASLQHQTRSPTAPYFSPNASLTRFVAVVENGGGLGNAMFVYASMLGLAEEYGIKAVLLEGYVQQQLQSCFSIQTPTLSAVDAANMSWTTLQASCCCCHEPQTFENLSSSSFSNFRVGLYLQSWKYFENIADEVKRHFFTFKPNIVEAARNIRLEVETEHCRGHDDCQIVGVHNRRGDYLAPRGVQHGYLVADADYFARAMAFLTAKFDSNHLVFALMSDDRPWLEEYLIANVSLFGHFEMAILPNATRSEADLCFLSFADHVIMSVGTFGWWGAYLSKGAVIYKRENARNGSEFAQGVAVADMMPPHWIGL